MAFFGQRQCDGVSLLHHETPLAQGIRWSTNVLEPGQRFSLGQELGPEVQSISGPVGLCSVGQPENDLVVIGVHLTSGQGLVKNHNRAMEVLDTKIQELRTNGTIPSAERDLFILGDFNASRFDNNIEDFWDDFDAQRFHLRALVPAQREDYPGTRLVGVPLSPRSQIDYIMASGLQGGLFDELFQFVAHVHVELLPVDFNLFREHVSDHLPVTVRIRVAADDD